MYYPTSDRMSSINKITVLGSGVMGHGIAQIAATAGYNVSLRDIEQSFLDKAMKKVKWSLNKLVEKNKLRSSDADTIYNRIQPVVDLHEALKDADMLVEAVPEDMALKRKVYSDVDKFAEEKTIYSSNTSTLPITEMGNLTGRPERFIGLHFFNPPQIMQLIEVIPGRSTNQKTIDMALKFVNSIGKSPVLCHKDVVGFIVNRIFIPMVHEAVFCQQRDNVSTRKLDSAVKFKLSLPMGILELADYTGIDVIHKATIEMFSRDSKSIYPNHKIEELFREGKLGQKSGNGFYDYKGTNYERIDLTEQEGEDYNPIKLVSVAANNASWLISNGVCNREELDMALKLGMGLKTDLFSTMEKFEVKKVIETLRLLQSKYGTFYEPDDYLLNWNRK